MHLALKIAIPVGLIATGAAIAGGLATFSPEAETSATEARRPLVETTEVTNPGDAIVVPATGTVEAVDSLQLTPQVPGTIQWVSDQLAPGARVDEGAALGRIDPTDYEAALAQANSAVEEARVRLAQERARKETAKQEGGLLDDLERSDLTLNKPQLRAAEAAVASAEAQLAKAQRDVERTWIRAPFDAAVVTEDLAPGAVVSTAQPIARLVSTDALRVRTSIPLERLPAIQLPAGDTPGARALVTQSLGGEDVQREGRVHQLIDELESSTRTAQLLIRIDDPWPADDAEDAPLPLLPGAFVDVSIEGMARGDLVTVPRSALRRGNNVWVVTGEQELEQRTLDIAWKTNALAWVSDGVEAGERVVVSPLSGAVNGLPVRLSDSTGS